MINVNHLDREAEALGPEELGIRAYNQANLRPDEGKGYKSSRIQHAAVLMLACKD